MCTDEEAKVLRRGCQNMGGIISRSVGVLDLHQEVCPVLCCLW